MDEHASESLVAWREWGDEAFEEARAEEKPVLLSLSARWCEPCHRMDETTYSRPTIAANLDDRFVPIRADADRQPRVRDRYNVGGFPSTVFATPDGVPMTGATMLGPDTMRGIIERIHEVWTEQGEAAGRVPRAVQDDDTPAGEVTPAIEDALVDRLRESFDDEHGGWGEGAKFPMARTVEFALERLPDQARRTLDAVAAHLQDDYDGGFFRYAETRAWGDPHTEKLLADNAALLRAYARAYDRTGEDAYLGTARRTAEYLTTTLWTDAAFAASQAADEAFYDRPPDGREMTDPPAVDPVALADGNALAVDALLVYHEVTGEESVREFARRALDYLRGTLLEDGAVAHYDDRASERGLLADQASVLRAFVTAVEALEEDPLLDPARAVADHAIETLQDGGAFCDGPATGPGLLDRPLRPLDGNAEMATALRDLAKLTGEERYADAARDAIAAFAGARDRLGVEIGQYAIAAGRIAGHE
jgi:uncharacterized protein YyaL (SSP411 family)